MSMLYKECLGSTAKSCLSSNSENRPETPKQIEKYRKSTFNSPGVKSTHYGIYNDVQAMGLNDKIYGKRSDYGGDTVSVVIAKDPLKKTIADQLNQYKNELVYKSTTREPLGSSMDRKIVLPEKFTKGDRILLN